MRYPMILKRLSFSTLFATAILFTMACTDDGQLGCSGHCDHPYDGKPGSCPKLDGVDREIGGSCEGWPGFECETGGVCVDGTCLPCGGDGELCCGQYGANPAQCEEGTCASTGDYPTCDDSCGTLTPGKDSCCPGNGIKCSEGACDFNTNKCIQPQDAQCTGAYPYQLSVTSGSCVVGTFFYTGDSDSDAQTCGDKLKVFEGGSGECPLNQPPVEQEVCETNFGSHTRIVTVCDASQVASCEQQLCPGCMVTMGACP